MPSDPTLHILLVDDNSDNRELILAYLKNTPYRVTVALDGAQALDLFTQDRYDLVVMDMQMPVMDGYTAARAIRDWERTNNRSSTPIVALTAFALKGDEEKCLEAGCTVYLTKPIKKATLFAAISKYASQGT